MDFQNKLANAFGHVKNARLLAQGGQVESHHNHVGWAMGNDPAVVKGEIRNDLQAALGCLDGNPALDQAASIFAYIKAARKIMENPPITITQEPLAGHRGWALTQPLSAIRQEARVQADTLRQLAAL